MKSGNLDFLEPSGPPQASNGTALPLPFTYCYIDSVNVYQEDCVSDSVSYSFLVRLQAGNEKVLIHWVINSSRGSHHYLKLDHE